MKLTECSFCRQLYFCTEREHRSSCTRDEDRWWWEAEMRDVYREKFAFDDYTQEACDGL